MKISTLNWEPWKLLWTFYRCIWQIEKSTGKSSHFYEKKLFGEYKTLLEFQFQINQKKSRNFDVGFCAIRIQLRFSASPIRLQLEFSCKNGQNSVSNRNITIQTLLSSTYKQYIPHIHMKIYKKNNIRTSGNPTNAPIQSHPAQLIQQTPVK